MLPLKVVYRGHAGRLRAVSAQTQPEFRPSGLLKEASETCRLASGREMLARTMAAKVLSHPGRGSSGS